MVLSAMAIINASGTLAGIVLKAFHEEYVDDMTQAERNCCGAMLVADDVLPDNDWFESVCGRAQCPLFMTNSGTPAAAYDPISTPPVRNWAERSLCATEDFIGHWPEMVLLVLSLVFMVLVSKLIVITRDLRASGRRRRNAAAAAAVAAAAVAATAAAARRRNNRGQPNNGTHRGIRRLH